MKQVITSDKGNLDLRMQFMPLLSDYLKKEDLELPHQIKAKRKSPMQYQELEESLQNKHLLRDLRLQ